MAFTAEGAETQRGANSMQADLDWLIGRRLRNVYKKDYSWFVTLDDGGSIGTEGAWRLVTAEGVFVTSEDHGHLFGLKTPVDACQRATAQIGKRPIERYEVDARTGDLSLSFGNATTVQFLQLSCGYENCARVMRRAR